MLLEALVGHAARVYVQASPAPFNFVGVPADNRGVDQVSRPMLAVLAAVVVLAGAWFTVLRPKSDDGASSSPTPAAQAPGVKGLSSAVQKAEDASAKSDAANARIQAATGGTASPAATTSKSAAAAKSATPASAANSDPKARIAAGDPSAPLLAKVADGKTLVVLFWNKRGADDRAVRDAVRSLKNKKIATAVAPIAEVGDYQAITTGVQVLTAPTVMVIGKDHKAKTVTGLTDAAELRQLVGDVRAGR
jgi:hypothetical protein